MLYCTTAYLCGEVALQLLLVLFDLQVVVLTESLHGVSQLALKLPPPARLHLHDAALVSAPHVQDLLRCTLSKALVSDATERIKS